MGDCRQGTRHSPSSEKAPEKNRVHLVRTIALSLHRPHLLWVVLGLWFFATIGLAESLFPRRYDWQHIVISSLASPRDNPHAYGIACASLAGTGLLLIPF